MNRTVGSISVIVPNYNYAQFLHRRLDSIINQTVRPHEIIFLDDCSTDDSITIAEHILSTSNIKYRIIKNEVNQGVFKQWLRGAGLVESNYFWIAEVDDYCEVNFLEKLLPAFNDEHVIMAYSDSYIINDLGVEFYKDGEFKNHLFETTRWQENFVADSVDEVRDYYSVINVSPNVSAIIFKKTPKILENLRFITQFKKVGDWMFYILHLISNDEGKVAYCYEKLNYHLRHENSVWISSRDKREPTIFIETLEIYLWVIAKYNISVTTQHKITQFLIDWVQWYDLNHVIEMKLIKLLSHFKQSDFITRLKVSYELRMADLVQISNKTQSQLNQVLSSRSWRMTKFLRVFNHIRRKISIIGSVRKEKNV